MEEYDEITNPKDRGKNRAIQCPKCHKRLTKERYRRGKSHPYDFRKEGQQDDDIVYATVCLNPKCKYGMGNRMNPNMLRKKPSLLKTSPKLTLLNSHYYEILNMVCNLQIFANDYIPKYLIMEILYDYDSFYNLFTMIS